jgi:predicted amidophosphoribosyltransferase
MKMQLVEDNHKKVLPHPQLCWSCNQHPRFEGGKYCESCGLPNARDYSVWSVALRAAGILIVVLLTAVGLFVTVRWLIEK